MTMALAQARDLLGSYQRRKRVFGPTADLFGDPAWTMLLDLYVSRLDGKSLDIGSLTAASFTPATTALRWIAMLEGRGLVYRRPDKADRRRSFIEMTPAAVEMFDRFLSG